MRKDVAARAATARFVADLLGENPEVAASRAVSPSLRHRADGQRSLPDPGVVYRWFPEGARTRVGPRRQAVEVHQAVPWFGERRHHGRRADDEAEAAVRADEAWRRCRELEGGPDLRLGVYWVQAGRREDPPGIVASPPDNGQDSWGLTVGLIVPLQRGRIRSGVAEAAESLRSRELGLDATIPNTCCLRSDTRNRGGASKTRQGRSFCDHGTHFAIRPRSQSSHVTRRGYRCVGR